MRFAWIHVEKATYAVRRLCRVLAVTPSGYYAWMHRLPSQRARDNDRLQVRIRAIHAASRGTYGSPRVHEQLTQEGCAVGRERVARLLRDMGLVGLPARRVRHTTDSTHGRPVAPNVLERHFEADHPNQRWTTDITFIWTWEGWLYLAVVLDLYARRVVGWAVQPHLQTELALEALQLALGRRVPAPGLVHHSDRGCQGEFNWSSQHLDDEVLQCRDGNGEGQTGRVGLRCVRLVGRRQRGVRSSNGSGRRSRGGCRVRMPLCPVACRRPWVVVGSVRAVVCRRSAWRPDRLATCPLRSGTRSRSCELRAPGCVTLPVGSGEPRRLSRESYVATRRLGAAVWRIGRRLRSGTAPDVPSARRSPSWPRTIG